MAPAMTTAGARHASRPPSLSYAALELGLMSLLLAGLARIEPMIGVRENGVFLVFGQTAMFFYLVHRLAFEIPATYFGLRGVGNLTTTYVVAVVMLAALYPACLWFRSLKAARSTTVSPTQITATFAAGSVPLGTYQLRIRQPSHPVPPRGPGGAADVCCDSEALAMLPDGAA